MDDELTVSIEKLSRDLRNSAASMTPTEARLLVDAYYTMQKLRIMNSNRATAMAKGGEPHEVISWLSNQSLLLEKQVAAALDKFRQSQPINDWLKTVHGIGPVLAAGLISHIDIHQAPTVGHIWSYAGLNPTAVWAAGQKRPWNSALKTLCWKIGESFKKFSNNEKCVYGRVYRERKEYEIKRNINGDHAELCAKEMTTRKVMTENQKTYYAQGQLPPGRIDLRAARYAVKQFLSDMHAVWYEMEFGRPAPKPYPIVILGHAHERDLHQPWERQS